MKKRRKAMEEGFKAMCKALRISPELVRSRVRTQDVSDKRTAIAYALLSEGYSVYEVAEAVCRNRTTVLSCARRVNAWHKVRSYYNQMDFVDRAQEALRRTDEGKKEQVPTD